MSVFDRKKKIEDEEITIPESYFNFKEYEIEEEIAEKIIKREDNIRNNLNQIGRNTKELAKSLYEIQQLLVNNKKGGFRAYLEYVEIKKDTAYRLIDKWNLFIDTNQAKVFELPHKTINTLKKEIEVLKKEDEKAELTGIVEILESDNIDVKLKDYKETKEDNSEIIIESSESIEKKVNKIEKEIIKLTEKISILEERKNELMSKI